MTNEDKIIDYLQGQLSFDEKVGFEKELANNHALNSEMERYRDLFSKLEEVKLEKPSVTLKSNFDHMLESELNNQSPSSKTLTLKTWRSLAAIAAVLVIGFLVGQNWTQRDFIDRQSSALVSEMKRSMSTESVTGRIEALQVSHKIENPEKEILKTLIETLKKDESPNVRLAAAEALNNYAKKDIVRSAFVTQLSVEKDPFVLIALINSLSEQKEKKAIDPLQNLTTAEDVAKFIKDEAHMGLIKIEKI